MTLAQLREQIDKIDNQLLRLLSERAELVHHVGSLKEEMRVSRFMRLETNEVVVAQKLRSTARRQTYAPVAARDLPRDQSASPTLAVENKIAIALSWTRREHGPIKRRAKNLAGACK